MPVYNLAFFSHSLFFCSLHLSLPLYIRSPPPFIMSMSSPMNVGMEWDEILSQVISLSCISVLSILAGAKTSTEKLRHLTYARLLILLVYLASWAFTTMSTILIATNNYNEISCALSILTCDVFYAGSKILIYAW